MVAFEGRLPYVWAASMCIGNPVILQLITNMHSGGKKEIPTTPSTLDIAPLGVKSVGTPKKRRGHARGAREGAGEYAGAEGST